MSLVQWNLLIRTLLGPAILSFVERLSSFRGDFSIECVYKNTLGLSFVGRFVLFRSVLYRRFHCIHEFSAPKTQKQKNKD